MSSIPNSRRTAQQRNNRDPKHSTSTEERLAALEARVEALETSASRSSEAQCVWSVDALRRRRDEMPEGAVVFGGELDVACGNYSYQWQRPYNALIDSEMWAASFGRLSALAHPLRGEILRRLLQSPAQVSELIDEETVTSPSTAYHHLSALSHVGWIKKSGSGIYEIAPARVIPLLTIISAS